MQVDQGINNRISKRCVQLLLFKAKDTWGSHVDRFNMRFLFLLLYIAITRIGHLKAAKVGFNIYGIPVFLTDMTLFLIFVASFLAMPNHVLRWMITGKSAGTIGRVVWLIIILAGSYFLVALPQYGILATRDLLICGYAIFFPLTIWAIRSRYEAVVLIKIFIYSGVLLAILLITEHLSGVNIGLFEDIGIRILAGGTRVETQGGGDVGGIIAFSLAALLSYIIIERKHRLFHVFLSLICIFALTIPQTRSAVVGLLLAGIFNLFVITGRKRIVLFCMLSIIIISVILSNTLPQNIPGVKSFENLYYTLRSGLTLSRDDNVNFRLLRWGITFDLWTENPILGIGFGKEILPSWTLGIDEFGLNAGLPHNTFLTILARTGILGFSLFFFAWIYVLYQLYTSLKKWGDNAENLALANTLVTMLGYSNFVLFFERPMHGATFWIMLAVGYVLSINSPRHKGLLAIKKANIIVDKLIL